MIFFLVLIFRISLSASMPSITGIPTSEKTIGSRSFFSTAFTHWTRALPFPNIIQFMPAFFRNRLISFWERKSSSAKQSRAKGGIKLDSTERGILRLSKFGDGFHLLDDRSGERTSFLRSRSSYGTAMEKICPLSGPLDSTKMQPLISWTIPFTIASPKPAPLPRASTVVKMLATSTGNLLPSSSTSMRMALYFIPGFPDSNVHRPLTTIASFSLTSSEEIPVSCGRFWSIFCFSRYCEGGNMISSLEERRRVRIQTWPPSFDFSIAFATKPFIASSSLYESETMISGMDLS
mmetsp:Transcript_14940/g.20785  ORF Transcript_14940/g.20785 Transcript_14940/m.20785 type:complete len:292 (+) Transcript_14940:211-1086(+)